MLLTCLHAPNPTCEEPAEGLGGAGSYRAALEDVAVLQPSFLLDLRAEAAASQGSEDSGQVSLHVVQGLLPSTTAPQKLALLCSWLQLLGHPGDLGPGLLDHSSVNLTEIFFGPLQIGTIHKYLLQNAS